MISFVICLKEIFIGSVFMLIYVFSCIWHLIALGGGGGGGIYSYVCVHRPPKQLITSRLRYGSSASFSCLRLFPHLLVKFENSFLCMCCRKMFCFSDHSPWKTNLKSIPFKVALSWKPCYSWRNYRKGLLISCILYISHIYIHLCSQVTVDTCTL